VRFRHALVVLFSLMAAVPAAAQTASAQCADADRGSISGEVLNRDGSAASRTIVKVGESGQMALAGTDGKYTVDRLCPGTYAFTQLDGSPLATVTLGAGQNLTRYLVLRESSWQVASLLGGTILLFGLGLLLFRHHNIVRTNRELLFAEIDNLAERIVCETTDEPKHAEAVKQLVTRAKHVKNAFFWTKKTGEVTDKYTPWEWFFWTRGRELAGWMRLHEIERELVSYLSPEQRVVERAVAAEADLRRLKAPSATVVADRIRQTLQEIVAAGASHPSPEFSHTVSHLKQQLGEGLALVYGETDTGFAELMEWHNKAMFLVYLALLGIATLGLVFHHEELFLLGAVGGLMSRMTRSLFRADVPNDYGASWTTLFLSPLLGAISAWVGIALIVWLREMGVLGATLSRITWESPIDAVMIATAFTLGFSERLFTSLLAKVEGKVTDELNKPPAPAAPPAPLSSAAGASSSAAAGTESGSAPITTLDRIVQELDLKPGERAAFMGSATSAARAAMVKVVGATNVVDVTAATIGTQEPFDGMLFETIPPLADLAGVPAQLAAALRPDGRVVIVGSTPAALFEGDAAAQRTQGHAGPAIVKEALIEAGLLGQDPPEKIGGTDPVEWIASFIKPAPGGGDR
jgi:hypothetical protein